MGGYNSLPALQIPDSSEGIKNALALKGAMQQQQMQSVQLQQQKMALKDQQALRELYIKHSGNLDKVIADAPQAGVSPQTIQGLQLHNIDAKTKTADLVQKQGANAALEADLIQGAHDAVSQAPEDQKPTVYQLQLQGLKQRGIDTSQMPPQYPGDEQFKFIGAMVKGHKQQVDDLVKQTELEKNKAQAAEAQAAVPEKQAQTAQMQANTAKINAEMNFYKKQGLAPGVPMDAQEAADWMSKNPGKTVSDYMKFKATLVPAYNFNLMNAGTVGPAAQVAQRFGMSPVSFDQAAEKYWTSGQLPPTGRGGPALALNKALMNRAAELHPEGSLAANSAEFKANQSSLASLQKNFDQVDAFERTAGKNLDVFLGTAQKVIDSGNPLINRPLRSITGAMGGTDQAAFNAARTTALTEIAKVLNSANASAVLSDSARHEVEGLIGPNATLKQIVSAANILKQDMSNRHDSYQQQISDIKGRLRGTSQQPNTQLAQPQSGGFDWNAHPKVNQ